MKRIRTIIMGAAGRDFHNFNVYFRDNERFEVICFTHGQLPLDVERIYPPVLAGRLYPDGIPIYPESMLPKLIKKYNVDLVVFSYSDVSHSYVMEKASIAMANGTSFMLLGPKDTLLESEKPVIAICAVRTGSGKSPTTRKISGIIKGLGLKVAVIRHPMPYGDLTKQVVMELRGLSDLDRYKCTVEEREDFTHLLKSGFTVLAGVDYGKVLKRAEEIADVIIWDGGNNDFPFIRPDLLFVVADPFRAGHEVSYYPGMVNFLMADVIVVNKVNSAPPKGVEEVIYNARKYNPKAIIVKTESVISCDCDVDLKGKTVAVVEDGPTTTHGGMPYGAGYLFAKSRGAKIIDPKRFAVGEYKKIYEEYSHLGPVIPAVGYSDEQVKMLEEMLSSINCDAVVSGTPIELSNLVKVNKPIYNVRYDVKEVEGPTFKEIINKFLRGIGLAQ